MELTVKRFNHSEEIKSKMNQGGRKAQWIAFSPRTKRTRVQFWANTRILDVAEIY